MGGDTDLFKGLITEHGIEVGNLEGLTRLEAVMLMDAWFQKQVKNKNKALTASHSTLKMLEKMPVINSAVDALTSSKLSTFPNDLKTSEQMDCKMGISYSSLQTKGYKKLTLSVLYLNLFLQHQGSEGTWKGRN